MVNPPKKSEQPGSRQVTKVTPSGQYPSRVSLTNEQNVCYASAVVQVISSVPALRALVSDIGSLPFSTTTGRDDFVSLNDPNLLKRRSFLGRLSAFCIRLETEDKRLPARTTLDLMIAMRKINKQFKLGKEDDPSAFFSTIVAILNDTGDKSTPLPTPNGETTPSTRVLDKALEERINTGGHRPSFEREVISYRKAHLATGYDSPVTRLMTLEIAKESVYSSKTCPSSYTRSFHFLNILHLSFPISAKGYNVYRAYSMEDLLGTWAQGVDQDTCEHDGTKAKETIQKIVGTPEILVLQVDRAIHTAAVTGAKDFVSNPLTIDETIDLREYCERRLPTERLYHEKMKSPPTKYKLRALIRHINGHFFTYALTPDTEGTLHWARFDDCRERVAWESPIASNPQNASHKHDFMFFYERVDPKTEEPIAADNLATAGKPVGGKEVEGKEVGGNEVGGKEVGAGEPIASLSGKEPLSGDQKADNNVVKQKDDSMVGDNTQKKDKEHVADKTSAHEAALYRNISHWAHCIPKLQAQVKRLEAWLSDHHVLLEGYTSASCLNDANIANMEKLSSHMQAQVQYLVAKEHLLHVLFDKEKAAGVTESGGKYDWSDWESFCRFEDPLNPDIDGKGWAMRPSKAITKSSVHPAVPLKRLCVWRRVCDGMNPRVKPLKARLQGFREKDEVKSVAGSGNTPERLDGL